MQEAKVTAVGTSTQLSIFADKLDMDIAIQGKASHGLENVILVQKTEKEPEKFGPWNLGEEQQRNKKRNELRTAVSLVDGQLKNRLCDMCLPDCTHVVHYCRFSQYLSNDAGGYPNTRQMYVCLHAP